MKKIGIISGKGGSGKSIIASSLAKELSKESNTLLIDSDLGFRTLDLMLNCENTIYDIYDFSMGIEDEMCINKVEDNEKLNFLCASQSKTVDDIDFSKIKDNLDTLSKYEYVIVDIPRDEKTIVAWADIVDEFILITEDNDISLRLTDKIMYIFIKNKIRRPIKVVFNKVDSNKEFDLEKKYELFMGPNVKIISKIPKFYNIEEEDLEEFLLFIRDIVEVIKGNDIVFREKKVEEKTFIQKLLGK
ncbi:P-loop NTPase [Peptoniphilus stercorisuis]|uniref:Septum formation inhibitor-activating ATPase MinD n=1 Tax=Peptoniphilus stercorisuis TaxID=1436965 RepID=A0ABS4KAE0_9FIRM|nr:P-loop NTPase [Peptoniphilus stercorisuis]MBP2024744.1 septum formation inhibitor-activating ATPase MinD [Peptoniphilus stercorisuis]